ncbi:MAG TPA: BT_3928 family protein [Edaphocola sp.]|nr:BT_3928 family protein [Edaphocola sp.]
MTNTVNKNTGYYVLNAIRIFVGILFIFSGLVKANDPLGLSYKMDEFFEIWNMDLFSQWSLYISIAMIAFEILAGVAMIIGYSYKSFSFLILLLTIFFTFLTGYSVFSGKIKECGCFGDCIPLQAHQSFIKDIILLVLVSILFIARKKILPWFNRTVGTIIMFVTLSLTVGVQIYVLRNLPFVDCLNYKVGTDIWKDMQQPPDAKPDVYETVLIYEKDGKRIEFSEEQFMADSTLWDNPEYHYIESKTELVEKGTGLPKIQDFGLRDFAGQDYTEYLLKDEGYSYLLFLKDADKITGDFKDLKNLIKESYKKGIGFYILSANDEASTNKFKALYGIDADAYAVDGVMCKTAMRSNGGLMLIKKGVIINKWSRYNYPKETVKP